MMNEKLSKIYRGILRIPLNTKNRMRLCNKNMTIFASNCVGGVLYHELGLPFRSPLINMYIEPCDFIKFCKNPKYYCSIQLIEVRNSGKEYPVALAADIKLFGVHYINFDELKTKWDVRCNRINWNNIFVMMSERDGCKEQDIIEFDSLPYDNKVVFVHKDMPEIKSAYHIPNTELFPAGRHKIKGLTEYVGTFTGKRIIAKFDYVTFFNKTT